jgi:hypothetical protein
MIASGTQAFSQSGLAYCCISGGPCLSMMSNGIIKPAMNAKSDKHKGFTSVTILRPYWDHPLFTSFSSIRRRHSSRCASPFDVNKPIWVYTVVHAMLLPCLGSPADAVCLLPCGMALASSPSFSFDISCSRLVSTFRFRPYCPFSVFLSHATPVDDTSLLGSSSYQ